MGQAAVFFSMILQNRGYASAALRYLCTIFPEGIGQEDVRVVTRP